MNAIKRRQFLSQISLAAVGAAITGKVSAAQNAPAWPTYNLKNRPTMRIRTELKLVYNRYKTEVEMWRSLGKF
ncbi:hypothetical protein AHMF7605_03740 [Adhaeribacter arboris]|uniref:Uncharacterized protein n=1 Tax=Adhaeribacter arboris TaxID=2072846 RepID=A0A2T2YB77_9BACT|nr:hypothetical protein [Adhaeribacter arboris]PSR52698.1 hypothetical protein AHMF7605_03740 [Adhaeribacter arboris]